MLLQGGDCCDARFCASCGVGDQADPCVRYQMGVVFQEYIYAHLYLGCRERCCEVKKKEYGGAPFASSHASFSEKKRAVAYMRLPILLRKPILFFLMRDFNGLRQFFPFAKGFPIDGFSFAIAI